MVRRLKGWDDAELCQILFVSTSVQEDFAQLLGGHTFRRTLTVGEVPQFLTAGGHISFFLDGSNVRFAMNQANVARTDLQISSKLMRVARIDRGTGGDAVIQWLRDLPIRRKLTTVITATSAVALVLASSVLLTWDVIRFRADLRDDLQTLTTIIADNSTAALSFDDPAAASGNARRAGGKAADHGRLRSTTKMASFLRHTGRRRQCRRLRRQPTADGLRELAAAIEIVRPIVLRRRADRHDLRAEQPGRSVPAAARADADRGAGAAGGVAPDVPAVVVAAAARGRPAAAAGRHGAGGFGAAGLRAAGDAARKGRDWGARHGIQRHAVADRTPRRRAALGQGQTLEHGWPSARLSSRRS